MKVIKKLKEKWTIKKFDFKPHLMDGHINTVKNCVFYCVDGIGDAMVCSPIINTIMDKCTGVAFFVCSASSQLYIELLKNKYHNIIVIPIGRKKDITEGIITNISKVIKKQGTVDVLVNGLGRISPFCAQLASLLKPQAVLSAMESAKRSSRPKMVHKSVHYANLLYRKGVSIVDCWGIIAQLIGGHYDRTLLFPIKAPSEAAEPYIAVSLVGASWGAISEKNTLFICHTISQYYKGKICLIASPGIENMCNSVASQVENVFVSPLPASLELSGMCIQSAQALVAVCSAPVHIAGAFNTPVLVIRGVKRSAWCPIVSHTEEYITHNRKINDIDVDEFDECFRRFIQGV